MPGAAGKGGTERHPEKHRRNEYAQAGYRHRAQHGQPADVLLHRSGDGGALLQLPAGAQRAEQPAEQVCHGFFRQCGQFCGAGKL